MSRRKAAGAIGSGLALLAAAVAFLGRDQIFTVNMMQAGETQHALTALQAKVGFPLRGVRVEIDRGRLKAELQNPALPDATDRWSVAHLRGLRGLVDWEYVTGPDPVSARPFQATVRELAFDLSDVDFASVPDVAAAAVARVALEETASASNMVLARYTRFGLERRIGAPYWTITVRSPHESARAFANARGRLTGTDLTGTLRAQAFDLYQGGQPLLNTVDAFRNALDGKERVRKAVIYRQNITFTVQDPRDLNREQSWQSGIDGAHPDPYQLVPSPSLRLDPPPEFTTADVHWRAVARLAQVARDRLGMQAAAITLIRIDRDPHAIRSAPVTWEFDLRGGGDEGSITLDQAGRPLRLVWPARRREAKRIDFLAPDLIASFASKLRDELDASTPVLELMVTPEGGTAVLSDPDLPQRLARLTYNGLTVARSDLDPEPPGKYNGLPYERSWLFDLASLGPDVLRAIPPIRAAALARLNVPGGVVTAIGVGRHQDVLPGGQGINIEIVVAGHDHQSARYFADLHGRPLRVEPP